MNYYSNQVETIERVIRGRIYYGAQTRDVYIWGITSNQLLTGPGGVGKNFVLSSVLIPKVQQAHTLAPPALLNNK